MKSKPSVDEMNRKIGRLAKEAFASAYEQALQSGVPFLAEIDGYLYQIQPNGTKIQLRKLPDRVPVQKSKAIAF